LSIAELSITEFTDPGCPFGWSSEPVRRRLDWLFGDQLQWSLRMVGLSRSPEDYSGKGFTPARQSAAFRSLSERHHMPMDTAERSRMSATVPACRAVVAMRLHEPDRERRLLRALQVRHFSGELLDDQSTLDGAALDVGLEPGNLRAWMSEPDTERILDEDLDSARSPSPEAIALSDRLARNGDGWRYSCPSYEIERPADGARMSVPGFQPLGAYEVAIANLLPHAHRRADPNSAEQVLAWAGEPLATVEVAGVCAIELEQAREDLGRVAHEQHVGFDGLWSLPGD